MSARKILITGVPGVGKTTILRGIAGRLSEFEPVGFFTEEIRRQGVRVGFALSDLTGRQGVLSHRDFGGPHRVGSYRVDVAGFESFLAKIPFFDPSAQLIVVDEIGKMECFSAAFRDLVHRLIKGNKPFVASVAKRGGGLIAEVKSLPGVELFELTRRNRDSLQERIAAEIRQGVLPAAQP